MTNTYPSSELLEAALAGLETADRMKLTAVPDGAGGFTLEGPAELLASLDAPPSTERLSLIANKKISELSAACAAEIMGGYTSSALGAPHTYPSKPTDQSNMQASVIRSLLPGLAPDWTTPFWCEDANGSWARRPHTAAQIQQAGQDGVTAVLAAQDKLAALSAAVASATSSEEISAIVWAADGA